LLPDAVLMIGFGGPTSAAEVRPFLQKTLQGRSIPQERFEKVVSHYEAVGGSSPYLKLTMRQAEALREALRENGLPLSVYVGMRNWHPSLDDAVQQMVSDGVRTAAGLVLAPHRSPASWENYLTAVELSATRAGGRLQVRYTPPWHDHPLFIEAEARRIIEATVEGGWDWKRATAIFTAHSIPTAMAEASGYVSQVVKSASLVAGSLAIPHWSVAYQSRSGHPDEPWLQPEIQNAIAAVKKSGKEAVVIIPIGFLSDHVEVLYDLDIDARRVAEASGLRYIRASTAGDHPRLIEMFVDLVRRA
jgi:ferrochelatase